MKIVWLLSAQQDLESLTDYIVEDNPRTALEIFTIIKHTIEKLAIFPFAGREGRVENTRELVIPQLPYIVVYQTVKEIRILAVLHTSRKWPSTF
ncbi:MAG: type II toxin-antitoxin system RelE/ParE family toxin [Candidatus Levybacteria bacterium]|nr:type II toxin-antitoxin system RelE/ParE family toxin [Candidatus Levybacteria bacterium]